MYARTFSSRIALLVIAGVLIPPAFGQTTVDEKTRREIQAVKDYIASGLARQTVRKVDAPAKTALSKPASPMATPGQQLRKSYFMNGNKISTEVYNYGGIGPGYGLLRGANNLVWRNMDYGFQFCPFVTASVPDAMDTTGTRRLHIVSDGLYDYPNYRERNPTGDTLWAWQPLPGYADPDQPDMASNPADDANGDGKPDSWPREWYNPTLGRYVWPGYLSQDALAADLEVFWAMDDRENFEFNKSSTKGQYFPYVGDSTRSGLGVRIDGRGFQWSNALAENCIFFVYTITNTSDKDLDSVVFGIYGDADLGGGSPENTDDWGYFIPPYDSAGIAGQFPVYSRSMVYFWDPDMQGARGLPLGYCGCKFLESPGNPTNGIDDDGDGIVDERQDDGIDNDKDWTPVNDDLGVDGIARTNDLGEGDGLPTAGVRLPDGSLDPLSPGEPNFELTDLDEADQIGLTSFNSWTWASDAISNDESMWVRCTPRNFSQIEVNNDIVFIFGSGFISLKKGETKRISMALLFGQTLDDLVTSAKTVQTIYNNNYRFFKPPITPVMTAVPGDKKVMLYWDDGAEKSIDPIAGKDFEGYVIYRSIDPGFNDIQTVTDGKGSPFLSQPLRDVNGFEAKWDVAVRDEPYTDANLNGQYDLGEPFIDVTKDGLWSAGYEDIWKGYHPVPYQDRGLQYYLGNNRGLVHSFVDSNAVINSQTYYYAVVAYDHGDSIGVPPTETTKKITVDPITSKLKFDVNTAQVIPGPRTSGYVGPSIPRSNIIHIAGFGTGVLIDSVEIINDLDVKDGHEYLIQFADSVDYGVGKIPATNYSVLDVQPVTQEVPLFGTKFAALGHPYVADDAYLKVESRGGTVYVRDVDYVVNFLQGAIRRTEASAIVPPDTVVLVTYRFRPVYQSRNLNSEDSNPVFDGIKLFVRDDVLGIDSSRSEWEEKKGTTLVGVVQRPQGAASLAFNVAPIDIEVRWNDTDTTEYGKWVHPGDTLLNNNSRKVVVCPFKLINRTDTSTIRALVDNALKDSIWRPGREIVILTPTKYSPPGRIQKMMGIVFYFPAGSDMILPKPAGAQYLAATSKPFTQGDEFSLKAVGARVDAALATSRLDNIYVVPNPYVGYSVIEPRNAIPGETRGERRVYFENLPARCTIRIFTLNGDLVQTIERDAGVENGHEFWNLLNREGFGVAYGLYVAHIDAPGIGEKIVKFALIK